MLISPTIGDVNFLIIWLRRFLPYISIGKVPWSFVINK